MANTYRYRHGETKPRSLAYKSGVAVQLGDLCYRDTADSDKVKPAGSVTWGAAVTTNAPAGTVETGTAVSNLTAGATGIKVSFNFPWGEGTLSNAGSVNVTGNGDSIVLTGVALPTNALSRNVYVETAQGSGTYKHYATDMGGDMLIVGYGIGRSPPTAVAQGALEATQYAFAQLFAGVAGQSYDGTNANAYGIKDGKLRIDTGGVFEFDTASASYAVGDLVGCAKASGNALEPQKVAAVAHESLAIGRVTEATSSQTTVQVEIVGRRLATLS